MTFTAIDCQSYAGGFAYGVVKAGFELIAKREQKGGFGVPVMEANRHLLGHKWQAEDGPAESWTPLNADLVFGNPPCSGFSSMSSGFGDEWRSAKNSCMWDLINYAAKCDPKIVIFESVQGAFQQGRDLMVSLRAKLQELTNDTWTLHHVLHNVQDLGGAQNRARYFFVASRIPFGVEMPEDKPPVTVQDRIGDLAAVPLDEIPGHTIYRTPRSEKLRGLAASGEWKQGEKSDKPHKRVPDIDIDKTDRTFTGFAAVRLNNDKPSRVLIGHAPTTYVHPTESRVLSHRELARLTGFPDEWDLSVHGSKIVNQFLFGKGICVEAGNWIAKAAYDAISGNPQSYSGEQIGENEFLIDAQLKNAHKLPAQPLFRLEGDW